MVTRLAAERVGAGGSVTGVDVAPDMIEVARGVEAPAAPSIEWHVADATALPLADGTHDVVLCQMGLMFVPDRAAAVAEMRRVLAAGGRVVISTPGRIQPPFELLEEAIVTHIGPELGGFVRAVFSLHDPDVLAALLRGAGLRDVSATVSTTRVQLPAPADFLWQYVSCTPMAPRVAAAGDAARAALEEQVVDAWRPFVTEASTPVEQPMVTATGRR